MRSDISVTIEGYSKTFTDITLRNDQDDSKIKGDEFLLATGTGRGIDVLVRKHTGRWSGWIAYGFGKTTRDAEGLGSYSPAHDRRHTFDIVMQFPGPLGARAGIRFGYGSPLPYTGITSTWPHREYNTQTHSFDEFDTESVSSRINSDRYPHYSRLDLSLRWDLGGSRVRWSPFIHIVNLYNRQNVFFYTFDYTSAPATRSGFSQLPLFPSVGVEVSW